MASLHFAANSGDNSVVNLLLSNDADPSISNKVSWYYKYLHVPTCTIVSLNMGKDYVI